LSHPSRIFVSKSPISPIFPKISVSRPPRRINTLQIPTLRRPYGNRRLATSTDGSREPIARVPKRSPSRGSLAEAWCELVGARSGTSRSWRNGRRGRFEVRCIYNLLHSTNEKVIRF